MILHMGCVCEWPLSQKPYRIISPKIHAGRFLYTEFPLVDSILYSGYLIIQTRPAEEKSSLPTETIE